MEIFHKIVSEYVQDSKDNEKVFLVPIPSHCKRIITLLLGFCITLLFLVSGCRDNPVTPIDSTKPGSRDYTWTVDTLKVPASDVINMIGMWGSSENDVWVVGHGDVSYNCVWHYEGTTWKNYGARLSSNHFSVFGFAPNDVWMTDAPNGEQIWHYDGSSWKLFGTYPKAGQSVLDLTSVWGDSPNNLYAAGFYETTDNQGYITIIHYDGKSWKYCDIPSFSNVSITRIRRDSQTGKYYLCGEYFGIDQNLYKVYEFDGLNKMTEIYSGPVGGGGIVSLINGRVYFSGGKKITRYANNHFETVNDLSSSNITIGFIAARSEKDIFAQAYEGTNYGIAHYNGTDWKMLYDYKSPPQIFTNNLAVFDSTVYFLMNDLSHTWVVKGKLKPLN